MENDKIDMSIADDIHFTGNLIRSAMTETNKEEQEFKIWDFDTFNAVLDASKVSSDKKMSYYETRKAIIESVKKLESYIEVLSKQYKMEKCAEEARYINENIYNDWFNFDAAYPEFHSVKSEERQKFLPI